MESVGRLAGGVAHDFNNMLQAILGNVELAIDAGGVSDEVRGALEEIRTSAERSADLTRQLLAFARKQTIRPRVLDLNEAIDGAITMLQRLIGEDVRLNWMPGAGVWPVKADPGQVERILTNLTLNARDAMDGLGAVGIMTTNVSFSEAGVHSGAERSPGDFVSLTVRDSGRGMDDETLAHLFEPFFTTKPGGKGTGLGLATVFGILRQNGGFIDVTSQPGLGTVFTVLLPRADSAAVLPAPPRAAELSQSGTETVLLVEDEPQILALGRQILRRHGYQVLTASNAAAAMAASHAHPDRIHLLVTDVIMPDMNGRDLANMVVLQRPDTKCLFMSGHTANVIEHHGVLNEGIAFIPKPFTVQEFLAQVRRALDRD